MAKTSNPPSTADDADTQPLRGPRDLPAVAVLAGRCQQIGVAPAVRTEAARAVLAIARAELVAGQTVAQRDLTTRVQAMIHALVTPRLLPVINATGVVLHTNLGRAAVSAAAAAAMAAAAANPVSLEIDPATNRRGGRMDEISTLMRSLTGAPATLVVNNGAAALLLTVTALAAGRAVIVSRGEAIEIGGGFRIPEVVRQSGAALIEVGTTNRTYVADYRAAAGPDTAAFLRIHASNFAMTGFVARPTTRELATAATGLGIPVIEDLGSGAILDPRQVGLPAEPTIGAALAEGAAVVTASGDKLLGGPQAGLICGDQTMIDTIARHPLARALRADKVVLAGLAATLRHYLAGEARSALPVWRMLAAPAAELQARASEMSAALSRHGIDHTIVETQNSVGGGALPRAVLPGVAITFGDAAAHLARRLRLGTPGVFGHLAAGRVHLELRTVLAESDVSLLRAILTAKDGQASAEFDANRT